MWNEHQFEIVNGIIIDVLMVPIIKKLWKNNIKTIMCCQGGRTSKNLFDDNNIQFYKQNNKYYECAWIILPKEEFPKTFKILTTEFNIKDISIVLGENNYWSFDDRENLDNLFICWRRL